MHITQGRKQALTTLGCIFAALVISAAQAGVDQMLAKRVAKRMEYCALLAEGKSRAVARLKVRISKKTAARIPQLLRETGGFGDRPMHQPARVFTEEVLGKAVHELIHAKEALNGQQLFNVLCTMGVLQSSNSKPQFLNKLTAYVKNQGHRLIKNCRKQVFFLSAQDQPNRVKYAKSMLELLKSIPLKALIFADEVTLEECPHPKCECMVVLPPSNCNLVPHGCK